MNVIGVDPSLRGTGIAHFDGELSTVKTDAKRKDQRLSDIYAEVQEAAEHAFHTGFPTRGKAPHRPAVAVIEDLPKQAMGAGITGMVQGVVRLALIFSEVPYIKIPPATLKKFATGKGNADKAAMREAWLAYTGIDNPDDNQVDAAFLRLIGLHLTGQPVDLPPTQLAAVAAYKDGFNV